MKAIIMIPSTDQEIRRTKEFKLLSRMLKEQKKSSKHISPDSLQNPTDPDAYLPQKGEEETHRLYGKYCREV